MKAIEPVRVRGRVHAGGRGLRGVAVTDGLSVVLTDAHGRYALRSHRNQPFVYITLPAGYRIPRSRTGTARFHRPLRPNRRGEATASFEMEPLRGSDEHHRMLLLADPQTQNEYEVGLFHGQTIPDVRALMRSGNGVPTFGIGCGDIMFDNLEFFPEYERAVERIGVPFFQVVGNHDIVFHDHGNDGVADVFSQHFGPQYYSLRRLVERPDLRGRHPQRLRRLRHSR